ncbi:hydrogenase expression/formation protein HypE [Leptothoe sp. ISB3NOV94-8A]|uniref:Hydrogenase expression/formation protein HypE n=1 Tax=Adonisia turfae CCMR0081 TaxID=2292702 RepID=A0A6M0RIK1_9CYAN|nr:hydrogenase expression/formation protein HypE [Adonisia turfae]MDV3348403.1 hydrogenase expression/formation protein HypE [Leptothoe sp. LEGE 181152]NEZ56037.1 hydrogenase expression/formation protein HypE [Adonisia turfae CCMR0081]
MHAACPIPIHQYPQVLLAHGGGGRLMHQLIETMLLATFQPDPDWQHDAASLTMAGNRLAFTTDSYVVTPLFFPGGDIGSLAVYGTVNDLAMAGARPHYLSLSFILEEGLPMETLWQVVQSIQAAMQQSHVQIVTGDTKVVDRGKGDGIFINTSGIGVLQHDGLIGPSSVQVGDVIILSGDVGRHGIAILSAREGLTFETTIKSDSAPLVKPVLELLQHWPIHCLRDLTRGGLASALNEIALAAHVNIELESIAIPVEEQVQGACEILGLDPLYIANEGRFVAFVPASVASDVWKCLQQYHSHAQIIGQVVDDQRALVTIKNAVGSQRILDFLSGEQLPRIC